MVVVLLIVNGCNKLFESLPQVYTAEVTSVTKYTAICGGDITSNSGTTITGKGICWSTVSPPGISDSKSSSGSGLGSFTCNISGLNPGTTYYVRAYATNKIGTEFGEVRSFTTLPEDLPVLTTSAVTSITKISAVSGGTITSDGGSTVTNRGICWSTGSNPTIYSLCTSNGKGIGSFTSNITGLSLNTTYYVRAYATNQNGTGYGNVLSFKTSAGDLAVLTTSAITAITPCSAISGGDISSDGGSYILIKGVCWSTSSNPTITDPKTTDGPGNSNFISTILGLNPNTTYYIRAYANNAAGTAYGNTLTFTKYII